MLQIDKVSGLLLPLLFAVIAFASASDFPKAEQRNHLAPKRSDLDTSATSAKLFNLGSLFGQSPNYGWSNGQYPNYNRPGYYPSTGVSGYYPNTGGSGYYPSTGYPSYGSGGYYPTTGGNYYPTTGGNYYPTTSGGSYYPTTGGGYYPTTGGGYYPGQTAGTNILGNGGYGGYGGNGGLRQYYGYWNPDYTGYRNRGYGYYADTDRYGLPKREGGGYSYSGGGSGGGLGGNYNSRGYN